MERPVEIRLLAGNVVAVEPQGELVLATSADERWVLCALLLDGEVSKRDARAALGLSDEAYRQVVSRLGRRHAFLRVSAVRGSGHVLDRSGLVIDALRLQDLATAAGSADPQERVELLREARALWGGGPPQFGSRTPPSPDAYLRLDAARRESLTSGRRILVVDDQIAERLARALRAEHVVETARSLAEFQEFEPRLHEFDLVVLDRHLEEKHRDSTGDKIAARINRRSDAVPVFMMTYRLPPEMELLPWQVALGLAGAITKEKDGERAYIERIVAAVTRVLHDGPLEKACLMTEYGALEDRRQAEKRLRLTVSDPSSLARQLEEMNRAAYGVVAKAQANDLAGARLARLTFRRAQKLD